MEIIITNKGQKIPWFGYSDQLYPGIQTNTEFFSQYGYLGKDETFIYTHEFKANRGKHVWKNVSIQCCDPFKLFCTTQQIEAEIDLISYPEIFKIPKLTIKPKFTLHTPGQNLSGKPGYGLNFWGVRDYQQGDSTNRILWRLSGRHPEKMFIKEFENENMAEIGVLIDSREKKPIFFKNKRIAEYSIQAGLSLSKSLLSDFNRISVFLLGNNRERIFSGIGKLQLNRIQNKLSSYDFEGNANYETINHIPLKIFPKQSIVFIISPLQENDDSIISRLVAEGHQVILICLNPFEDVNFVKNLSYEESLGFRFLKIERTIMLHKIQKMGVLVWKWNLNTPFSNLINSAKNDLMWRKVN